MKIKVLIPNSGMSRKYPRGHGKLCFPVPFLKILKYLVDCIAEGPDSIESNTDESLAASL